MKSCQFFALASFLTSTSNPSFQASSIALCIIVMDGTWKESLLLWSNENKQVLRVLRNNILSFSYPTCMWLGYRTKLFRFIGDDSISDVTFPWYCSLLVLYSSGRSAETTSKFQSRRRSLRCVRHFINSSFQRTRRRYRTPHNESSNIYNWLCIRGYSIFIFRKSYILPSQNVQKALKNDNPEGFCNPSSQIYLVFIYRIFCRKTPC